MKNETLLQLAAAWQAAKQAEKDANAHRLEIEAQIVAAFPPEIEGTNRTEVGPYRVAVTHTVNRTVDTKALQAHWASLSSFAQDVFTWKASVSKPLLVNLQMNHPDLMTSIVPYITSKPGKPGVEVTLKEDA